MQFASDVRHGFRLLRCNPGLTAIAVLILALGVGFNCAIFDLLNTVLLHTPPYPHAEQIVELRQKNPARGLSQQLVSIPEYIDWHHGNHVFESMAAWNFQYFNLTGADAPERVEGLTVTEDFFSVMGIHPALGRSFVVEDQWPDRRRVVMLSDGLWKRRFGGDPAVVGRTVPIEGEPYVVVGVLPQDFRLFRVLDRELDLYVPHKLDAARSSRADRLLFVYGRLKPGISIAQAQADMDAQAAATAAQYPDTNTGWGVEVNQLQRQWTRQIRPTLLMLQAAAGIVLLIMCANLASLLFARSLARQHEMAIRVALGASRRRLTAQLLTESMALAVLSGAAGTATTLILVGLANRIPYSAINRVETFRPDARVLGFGVLLAAIAAVAVGGVSALAASARHLRPDALRKRRLGDSLVFCQVALTVVLMCGAGLLVRSTLLVNSMDRGLDSHNVLSAQVWLPPARYRDALQLTRFWRDAVGRVSALPEVRSATAVNFPPLSTLSVGVGIQVEGVDAGRRGEEPVAQYWVIGPRYFETCRIPLLRGRVFDNRDNHESQGVVVISAAMGRRFWPDQTALGKRLRPLFPATAHYWLPRSQDRWLTVIGVVGDVHLDGIAPPLPQMYLPYTQSPTAILHLLVRTEGDPSRLSEAIRREVAALDRDQPIFDVKSLQEVMDDSTTRSGVLTELLSGFAVIAVVLALLGIYGITACWTSRRSREIGIRIALGARPVQVIQLVTGQGLRPVIAGIVAGLVGAGAATRVLRSLLVGVTVTDSLTFAMVAIALLLAAAAATYVPARQAARIAPMEALRHE